MAVDVQLPDPDRKAAVVEAMFDRIADRYDLLNGIITFRLDGLWRRKVMRLARVAPGDVVVDLGCGTGDMCLLASRYGARVIGIDFSARMLEGAKRRKVPALLLRADAAAIPLETASVTVVTSGFTVRNLVSLEDVLRECARVLVPGGRLAFLEVDEPRNGLLRRAHHAYFHHVVPFIGSLLSDRWAYSYLPRSAVYLPPEPEFERLVEKAGFRSVTKHRLSGGVAQIISGVRA